MATEVVLNTAETLDSLKTLPVDGLKKKIKRSKKPLTTASSQSTLNETETKLETVSFEKDDSAVEENKNPYMEVIQKRLRTLRKRQAKLESYAALNSDGLQRDQVEALAKLPEVQSLVHQLEEVLRQMSNIEGEEARREKSAAKKREMETFAKVKEAQREGQASMDELFKTLYLWNVLFEQNKPDFDAKLTTALLYLRGLVSGAGLQPLETMDVFVENARHHWKMFLSKSEDDFMGLDYKTLYELSQSFANPPSVAPTNPKFFDSAVISASEMEPVPEPAEPVAASAEESQSLWFQAEDNQPAIGISTETTEYVEIPASGIKFGSVTQSEEPILVAESIENEAKPVAEEVSGDIEVDNAEQEAPKVKSVWKNVKPSAPKTSPTEPLAKGPRPNGYKQTRFRKNKQTQPKDAAAPESADNENGFQQVRRRTPKSGETFRGGKRDFAKSGNFKNRNVNSGTRTNDPEQA